ncbi:hypothetical protein [Amycolatopsis sp. NPDC051071]|uniref:hypothetical protein n=1 Tax=Amycolatopsis sp. NPDC051071 TaxID=3154637 RepID=UPI00342FD84E
MSYPQGPHGPQGPQWGQPHPGQQPYPQQSYPQQQYPPQQGYPPPGYGGPQFPGQQPPPKKGNGLMIGLIAGGGGLVLVIFVILAFVAPGFLVSDSKSSSSASATQTPLSLDWGPVLAGKFMLAVFGDEADKAAESACADSKEKVRAAAKAFGDQNASLTAKDPRQAGPDLIVLTMSGTLNYETEFTATMEVRRESGDKYCISSVSPLPPPA